MSAPAELDFDRLADRILGVLRDGLVGAGDTSAERRTKGSSHEPEGEWTNAAGIARRFGLSRPWVYAHKERLGVEYQGEGPRPRLRFNLSVVAARLAEMRPAGRPAAPSLTVTRRAPSRRAARGGDPSDDLLPIKGRMVPR